MAYPVQNLIVQAGGKKKHKAGPLDAPVALWNADGTPFGAAAAPGVQDLEPQAGPMGPQGEPGPAGPVGEIGPKGDPGLSLTAIELTADKDGKITGGTATLSDGSTIPITVKQA